MSGCLILALKHVQILIKPVHMSFEMFRLGQLYTMKKKRHMTQKKSKYWKGRKREHTSYESLDQANCIAFEII